MVMPCRRIIAFGAHGTGHKYLLLTRSWHDLEQTWTIYRASGVEPFLCCHWNGSRDLLAEHSTLGRAAALPVPRRWSCDCHCVIANATTHHLLGAWAKQPSASNSVEKSMRGINEWRIPVMFIKYYCEFHFMARFQTHAELQKPKN